MRLEAPWKTRPSALCSRLARAKTSWRAAPVCGHQEGRAAVPQDRPVMVIAGGQPGAGKTTVADLVQAALDRRGGAVRIGRDLYKVALDRRGGAVRIGRDLYKVALAATGQDPSLPRGQPGLPLRRGLRVSRRQRCSATLTATGELSSP
ncbi:zeta toxin family protein [Streptomyces collinus]|uniref:zeta toxin family protein n=1 Tax=Streptomyces collinus TaxID=42684 RepID=UPI00379FB64E